MKRTVWDHKWIRDGIRFLGTAAILAASFFAGRQAAVLVSGGDMGIAGEQENRDPYEKMQKFCVVVDAGHGERIRER